ncbi:MAG TPA: lysine 2,3-aminomutase, partial [Gammaproteobacteria bacterium]|nr:lysine 2,3-aminomutase [Gammaproteobacteria bacterium]
MTKKTLRSVQELVSADLAPADEHAALAMVAQKYAVAVSPHLMELIRQEDGIRNQFIPTAAELVNGPRDMTDPIGDK